LVNAYTAPVRKRSPHESKKEFAVDARSQVAPGSERRLPHLALKRLVGVHQPNCQRTMRKRSPSPLQGAETSRKHGIILATPFGLSTLANKIFQPRDALSHPSSAILARILTKTTYTHTPTPAHLPPHDASSPTRRFSPPPPPRRAVPPNHTPIPPLQSPKKPRQMAHFPAFAPPTFRFRPAKYRMPPRRLPPTPDDRECDPRTRVKRGVSGE